MPKSTTSYLVDVNVWLAISYDLHVHHVPAGDWFEAIDAGQASFCRLTQLGFLRLVTNRHVMGGDVVSQLGAWSLFDKFQSDARVSFLAEPDSIDADLRHFTRSAQPLTHGWSDAYLAALAKATGMIVVTLDRGFKDFAGVDVLLLKP